ANSPFRGETWTAEWTPDGVTPMSAVAVFGQDASDADRQRIFDAFAGLTFPGPADAISLPFRTDGRAVVASGSDLGHTWELRYQDGSVALGLDGTEPSIAYRTGGSWAEQIDVDRGMFLLAQEPEDVAFVRLSSDVSGRHPIADG